MRFPLIHGEVNFHSSKQQNNQEKIKMELFGIFLGIALIIFAIFLLTSNSLIEAYKKSSSHKND